MDFSHPFRVITNGVEGDILGLLASGDRSYTSREVERTLNSRSYEPIRLALKRLEVQGIITAEPGGARAVLYRFNAEHLAAPYIQGIALLRQELIARLRATLEDWPLAPAAAVVFGSVSRGQATEASDLDVLVIRPQGTTGEDPVWQAQLAALSSLATRWTGNDARVLEYGYEELSGLATSEPVLENAARDGIDLMSSTFRLVFKQAAKQ